PQPPISTRRSAGSRSRGPTRRVGEVYSRPRDGATAVRATCRRAVGRWWRTAITPGSFTGRPGRCPERPPSAAYIRPDPVGSQRVPIRTFGGRPEVHDLHRHFHARRDPDRAEGLRGRAGLFHGVLPGAAVRGSRDPDVVRAGQPV